MREIMTSPAPRHPQLINRPTGGQETAAGCSFDEWIVGFQIGGGKTTGAFLWC